MLARMPVATSVRLDVATRDALRALADSDNLTMAEEIALLIRRDRQRRLGEYLATVSDDAEEQQWAEVSISSLRDAQG